MRIGFTGTRRGIPYAQATVCASFAHRGDDFHFGDCVGADAQVWDLVRRISGVWTVAHPPENPKLRAFCQADIVLDPKPYIERNHDIVDSCDLIVAAPRTATEEMRSGTWATIRYARQIGRMVKIIGPSGMALCLALTLCQGAMAADGVASTYGPGDRWWPRTSSGERSNTHEATAAHRTLPLGSHAEVTNLSNGRSVVVRINDRGPWRRG